MMHSVCCEIPFICVLSSSVCVFVLYPLSSIYSRTVCIVCNVFLSRALAVSRSIAHSLTRSLAPSLSPPPLSLCLLCQLPLSLSSMTQMILIIGSFHSFCVSAKASALNVLLMPPRCLIYCIIYYRELPQVPPSPQKRWRAVCWSTPPSF